MKYLVVVEHPDDIKSAMRVMGCSVLLFRHMFLGFGAK